ncbi:MAG: FkbM family methyltransferase, partial [Magnetococcales bacterium]|nr:FkbM family methyltransferase [Magnetococcales bacterium]
GSIAQTGIKGGKQSNPSASETIGVDGGARVKPQLRRSRSVQRSIVYRDHLIYYRPGTDDVVNIEKILFKGEFCEYRLPHNLQPSVILDAGANIGISTLYFKWMWPDAQVICCEASKNNLELLHRNTSHLHNVQIVYAGLMGMDGWLRLILPPKDTMVGSYAVSKMNEDEKQEPENSLEALSMTSIMKRAGVSRIDLLKIDIEGSEHDVLMNCPDEILSRIVWIVGEMHGVGAFEILNRLAQWFDIDVKKTLHKSHYKFNACNRNNTGQLIQGFKVKRLQA